MNYRWLLCYAMVAATAAGAQTRPAASSFASKPAASPETAAGKVYLVPTGTKVLLSLKEEIDTRTAKPGDPVYFISEFPVVESGVVVLPAGMYVQGSIDSVQRAGRVHGRAELHLHFNSIIFPNGAQITIPGSLEKVPGSTGAQVADAEGTVKQSGGRASDAGTIADDTVEGTGIGGLVGAANGNIGKGLGIGAGAGAAAGILTTMLTRGKDIVIPQGTTVEMWVERTIRVQQQQLADMPGFTGQTIAAAPGGE